jgi:hypothetical protein
MASHADNSMSMGFNFDDDLEVHKPSNTYGMEENYNDMADTESNADYNEVSRLVNTQRTLCADLDHPPSIVNSAFFLNKLKDPS